MEKTNWHIFEDERKYVMTGAQLNALINMVIDIVRQGIADAVKGPLEEIERIAEKHLK